MTIVNYKEFFEMIGYTNELPNKNGMKGRMCDGITSAQQRALRNLGVGTTGIRYKGQAMIVLDLLIDRANKHLATPGQMRKLGAAGFQHVGKITYSQAVQYLSEKNAFNEEREPWEA